MKLSLIIPFYNEEKIIKQTIIECNQFLQENFSDYELIAVDDGSLDNSRNIAESTGVARVISYPKNRGKGCAVRTGICGSTGDIVVYTDADLAFGLDQVKGIVAALEQSGADLVLGTRKGDGYQNYPFVRKVASKSFLMVLRMFGLKYSDSQCGIKALSGDFARKVFALCKTDNFAFDFEMILVAEKLGGTISEYSVKIVNHRDSTVNIIKDSIKMLKELVKIKTRVAGVTRE